MFNGPLIVGSPFKISFFARNVFFGFLGGWFGLGGGGGGGGVQISVGDLAPLAAPGGTRGSPWGMVCGSYQRREGQGGRRRGRGAGGGHAVGIDQVPVPRGQHGPPISGPGPVSSPPSIRRFRCASPAALIAVAQRGVCGMGALDGGPQTCSQGLCLAVVGDYSSGAL